jgi:hypothetical protein
VGVGADDSANHRVNEIGHCHQPLAEHQCPRETAEGIDLSMSFTTDPLTADIDPVGVVAVAVGNVDPGMSAATVRRVIEQVGGGRAKRRRLAAAITENPTVLTTGRSPAPSVVGELLLALRAAGARGIAAPCCAGCERGISSIQRRGGDWFCSPCFKRPQPCAGCGNERQVAFRDRHGQARCGGCRDQDPDPRAALIELITGLDPALTAETVATAIDATITKPAHVQKLLWALQARPELLTGEGAHAPFPMILRLIDALVVGGATVVRGPACPRCGRVVTLSKRVDGVRVCRGCRARATAVVCSRCGDRREPAARDAHGQPLCAFCLVSDPVNHEICSGCGRLRTVAQRGPDGPVCGSCVPATVGTCSICRRTRPCRTSTATGSPWCANCAQTWATCTGCGTLAPIRSGTRTTPFCASCTDTDASVWKVCPSCGEPGQLLARDCTRCRLRSRVTELLTGPDRLIRPELRGLHDALVGIERPGTVLNWLTRSTAGTTLAELAASATPLTHAVLDELPATKTLAHLRAVLVATGSLPARDEHLAQLEQWTTLTIAASDDPDDREILHRYAHWHVLRRLRQRTRQSLVTANQAAFARGHIRAAVGFFGWLSLNGLNLATVTQGDLDRWITDASTARQGRTGPFVRWARRQRLTRLDFPATAWHGPTGVVDAESRWDHARRLLNGESTVALEERVAGLLIVLYAQTAATISRLTIDDVDTTARDVTIRFGRAPILLLEPVGDLVRQLVTERRGHGRVGADSTARWLFPGGRPGQPISSSRLTERLRHIGLIPGQARTTALFQLAAEIPAAILARLLGIHVTVAVKWQHAASGDWANYAADVSRRTTTPTDERT